MWDNFKKTSGNADNDVILELESMTLMTYVWWRCVYELRRIFTYIVFLWSIWCMYEPEYINYEKCES